MIWLPWREKKSSDEDVESGKAVKNAGESDQGCWMEGADLHCNVWQHAANQKDWEVVRKTMSNFYGRYGYHLHSAIHPQQAQMSRDELLNGPAKTPAQSIFRRLILNKD